MTQSLKEILGGSIAEMMAGNGAQVIDAPSTAWSEGLTLIDDLVFDPAFQMRVEMFDDAWIEELMEKLANGEDLGKIEVHIVSGRWCVTDGWQRTEAYRRSGYEQAPAVWRVATWDEALDAAFQANTKHGKQLSDGDKHNKLSRAVERHRADLEDGKLSMTRFARRAGLTVSFVYQHLSDYVQLPTVRTVERNGVTYKQDTSRIGRPRKESSQQAAGGGVIQSQGTSTASRPARRTVNFTLPADYVAEFKEYIRAWEGADEIRNLILSQV